MMIKIYSPSLKKPNRYFQAAFAILLSLSLLSACQKTPEPVAGVEATADTDAQATPVTSNINAPKAEDNKENTTEADTGSNQETSLTKTDNDGSDAVSSDPAIAPNPEQAIKGAQITDVNYRSATGETLFVVFETSEKGVLNAIITLPNKPKMTLSAPEGQGNNPTYRSNDGSIQLVSHGGGGSIDLIQNNKVTSFDAISVEAEVIAE